MKNLEEASYILEMKIYRNRMKRLLGLSQSTYINTMLKQFSMKNFKKVYLSIDHENFLSKRDCLTPAQKKERMSKIPYASAVRSIMHAMTCTRLDCAYSLGVVSKYQSDPRENY